MAAHIATAHGEASARPAVMFLETRSQQRDDTRARLPLVCFSRAPLVPVGYGATSPRAGDASKREGAGVRGQV